MKSHFSVGAITLIKSEFVFFLLIQDLVRLVSYDTIVNSDSCCGLRFLKIDKSSVIKLANNIVFALSSFAYQIHIPVIVLQKLIKSDNCSSFIDLTLSIWVAIKREEFALHHNKYGSIFRVSPDNSIARIKLLRLNFSHKYSLVSLFDALQERSENWVLQKEFSCLFHQVALGVELDCWVSTRSNDVVIVSFKSLICSNL